MRTNSRNYLAAMVLLVRVAAGLALHGLVRPRTDCAIERATGRVCRAVAK